MSTVTRKKTSGGGPALANGVAAPLAGMSGAALWHGSAPSAVRSAWDGQAVNGDAWKAWSGHLNKRATTTDAGLPASAVAWGLPAGDDAIGWMDRVGKLLKQSSPTVELLAALEAWFDNTDSDKADSTALVSARESVFLAYAAARALPKDADLWWRIVDRLRAVASAAGQSHPGEDAGADAALAHQMLAGELPLVLSILLPEIKPLRGLRKAAAAALTDGVLALTDGEGLPPARMLTRLPELVACWTRCRALAEQTEKKCWDSQAETQYEWLVRQSLRLVGPGGRFALGNGSLPPEAWAIALGLGADESDLAAASQRLRPKPNVADDDSGEQPPTPSVDSEWSGLAVLASGWKPKAPRLTVDYEGADTRIELVAEGRTLLRGVWPVVVSMDGKPVATRGEWEQQCWFSDDDSDYLELAIELQNGARLERQLLVAHDRAIAYLSEIVLSKVDEPGAIEVETLLPLAEGAAFAAEEETREGTLNVGGKPLAGVVPLSLPEWRTDPRGGELAQRDQQLRLSEAAVGRNLCCPLLLDLKPRRFAKQRTWRQLAVAQQLERVAPDVAVGYRYQSGKDQWLIYRSLEAPANRTVLGQNYSSEALVGRFLPTGEVDEYFEIETEE